MPKKLAQAVTKRQKHGKTLVLKLRYSDFETLTKRITRPEFLPTDSETYYFYAKQIFDEIADFSRGIRLLGITITNLSDQSFQEVSLPLFKHEECKKINRERKIATKTIIKKNNKIGKSKIRK